MTTPFGKKVDILTDWHNKMPDTDLDLMSELIVDVWHKAEDYFTIIMKEHTLTKESLGGFLRRCNCGEAVDDYKEHLIDQIRG